MEPFVTKASATGREYWKLKRLERERYLIFFVLAEMVLVAAAILFGLILNRGRSGRIVFDAYFGLAIGFGVAAVLLGGAYLMFFFWYGYRPAKASEVKIDPEKMTFEAELVGFTGKNKIANLPIGFCVDNGAYTKLGKSRRHFIWLADNRLEPQAKEGLKLIQERLNKENGK